MNQLVSELINRPELYVAAHWWAKTLMSDFVNDAGDFMASALSTFASSVLDKPKLRNVESFKTCLICLMAADFSEKGWDDDNPNRGSGLRVLAVDYGPNHILNCALDFCGLQGSYLRLPIKTVMWVSPGKVTVRQGYSGKEVELMVP